MGFADIGVCGWLLKPRTKKWCRSLPLAPDGHVWLLDCFRALWQYSTTALFFFPNGSPVTAGDLLQVALPPPLLTMRATKKESLFYGHLQRVDEGRKRWGIRALCIVCESYTSIFSSISIYLGLFNNMESRGNSRPRPHLQRQDRRVPVSTRYC